MQQASKQTRRTRTVSIPNPFDDWKLENKCVKVILDSNASKNFLFAKLDTAAAVEVS
jgi:hypothetical protein